MRFHEKGEESNRLADILEGMIIFYAYLVQIKCKVKINKIHIVVFKFNLIIL